MAQLTEIPGLPGALLSPAWAWPGVVPQDACPKPSDGNAVDVGRWNGFTICARVRKEAEEGVGCRILQKGEPPLGWTFSAPSAIGGVVAFAAGVRATEPAAAKAASPDAAEAPDDGEDAEPVPPRGEDDIGSARVDDGQWHHVAVSYVGGHLCAYVDGKLDGEVSIEVPAAPGSALMLGPEAPSETTEVRDIQVFREALIDTQIAELADECKDLPTGVSLPLLPTAVVDFLKLQAEARLARDSSDRGGPDESSSKAGAARTLVSEALGLGQDPQRSFQDEVICDFFVGLLEFGESINLTARKSAVIVGIMQRIFDSMKLRSKTTPDVGEPYSASESFLEYKRLLLAHAATSAASVAAAAAPPGALITSSERLPIFTIPDVKQLTEYVAGVLFEHYLLYQCTLLCPQDSVTGYVEVTMERPRACPDLKRAKMIQSQQGRTSSALSNVPRGYPAAQATMGRTASNMSKSMLPGSAQETPTDFAGDTTKASSGAIAQSPTGINPKDPLDHHIAEATRVAEEKIQASIQQRDEALAKARAK